MLLGEYSTAALAATISVTGVFWAPMALVQQTSAYVTTFVAQHLGAGQHSKIGASVWQALYVSVFGGLLFLLLIPVASEIFRWVGHSSDIQNLEVGYFKALAWSALPTALVAACSGFYTGLGRSHIIIAINAIGMVGNLVFDYIFIFGHFGAPEMGIVGAGYATAIGSYLAALFGLYLIFYGGAAKRYHLSTHWRLDYQLFSRFLKFGLPSGLQWALEGLAFTLFIVFIGHLPNGEVGLAASSIAMTIMMLAVLPNIGLGQGVSALVGQHLGSNRPKEATEAVWAGLTISLFYTSIMGLSFLSFPDFYTSLFNSSEPGPLWLQVEELAPTLLLFVAGLVMFDAINFVMSFALKGAGDTLFVSLVALLLPWPVMVFPAWYMSDRDDGIFWAWSAASCYIVLQALVFLGRFLGGRWKSMRVI